MYGCYGRNPIRAHISFLRPKEGNSEFTIMRFRIESDDNNAWVF